MGVNGIAHIFDQVDLNAHVEFYRKLLFFLLRFSGLKSRHRTETSLLLRRRRRAVGINAPFARARRCRVRATSRRPAHLCFFAPANA